MFTNRSIFDRQFRQRGLTPLSRNSNTGRKIDVSCKKVGWTPEVKKEYLISLNLTCEECSKKLDLTGLIVQARQLDNVKLKCTNCDHEFKFYLERDEPLKYLKDMA